MISHQLLFRSFLFNECWKWSILWWCGFKSTRAIWMTPIQQISIKSERYFMMTCCSNQSCCMKYWKQRNVGVDFDRSRPCLSSAALLCVSPDQRTATCVSDQSLPPQPETNMFCWSATMITFSNSCCCMDLINVFMSQAHDVCHSNQEPTVLSCWLCDRSFDLWHKSIDLQTRNSTQAN